MTLWIILICLLGAAVLLMFGLRQTLQISEYELGFDDLPPAFDGFRIAQVSDLHGCHLPDLPRAVQRFHPDLIACTGDCFDGVQNRKETLDLIRKLLETAPVCFVSGNHEYYGHDWTSEKQNLMDLGVVVLDDSCIHIVRDGQTIEICGIQDPDLDYRWPADRRLAQMKQSMNTLPRKELFRILLFHRADLFEECLPVHPDLVLSGHLHGGQWRVFGQGLVGPNNGDHLLLLPRYASGIHSYERMKLAVSRGLGDQMKIPRLFNRPELVLITLRCGNSSRRNLTENERRK